MGADSLLGGRPGDRQPHDQRTQRNRRQQALFSHRHERRRCLVPADGFYEWKKSGKLKQPYYIGLASREPFAIAGLWETWRRDDERIESVTLLTTDANALLLPLHDRMPVILAPADYDLWLDPSRAEAGDVQPLLRPFPDDQMTLYPVSTLVNSPSHEDPRCIEPIQVEP